MVTERALVAALAAHARVDLPALPGKTNHLESAVLIPIVWEDGEPIVIATVRADGLRHHAGEVCFPGGRPDPGDEDLTSTALREAREELGIARSEILGELSSVPLFTSEFRMFPYVARIAHTAFDINRDEVAEVLRFPLQALVQRDTAEAFPWRHKGLSGLSPIFRSDAGHVMFGATAHAMYELVIVASKAAGLEAPSLVAAQGISWADVLPPGTRTPDASLGPDSSQ